MGWGGNLLWCGSSQRGSYVDAERLLPKWNRAMLFMPHAETMHSIEVVRRIKGASNRRLTFTSWQRVRGIDSVEHYAALLDRIVEFRSRTPKHKRSSPESFGQDEVDSVPDEVDSVPDEVDSVPSSRAGELWKILKAKR